MQVDEYKEIASRKSDLERTELQKEKTGVFSGCYARNPANGEAIPIWVADYVLGRCACLYFLCFKLICSSVGRPSLHKFPPVCLVYKLKCIELPDNFVFFSC